MSPNKHIDHTHFVRLLLTALVASCLLALTAAPTRALEIAWDGAPIAAEAPGGIATDGAGRIYVPLRGKGLVNIYDNARGGNRLLASIGAGQLQDPVSVAIDVRSYIYVADAAKGAIVSYSPYFWGATLLGSSGAPGVALGQFAGLGQIAVDNEPRIFAAESGNARVQALDPDRGALSPMFAFGTSDPDIWGPLTGLALDSALRIVVSSSDPSMPVRRHEYSGTYVGPVLAAGGGPGQVAGPLGLNFDSVDRLMVADTGNNRVAVFSSIPSGLTPQAQFGSAGSGEGQFDHPGSLALAPGALLYVADTGNNRIVRLRYDDADRDSALDATDNCPGLANPDQSDADSDGRGDACDEDIDGDGLANASDRCPLVRPYFDRDGDGCQDPFSTLKKLLTGLGKAGRVRISGHAGAGTLGVARVEVAVVRLRGRTCWWYRGHSRFSRGSCAHRRYVRARGTTRWHLTLPARSLARGRYRIYTRALQRQSAVFERPRGARMSFRVR